MPRKKSKTQRRLKLWARRAERLLSEIPATEYPNILKEAEKLCANARAEGTGQTARKSGSGTAPANIVNWWINRPG